MTGAIAIILVLGGLIFFHELGHFLVARGLGIGVKTFSLGFGPKLFSFMGGKTRYQLSAVPLGGYVALVGESDEEDLPEEFSKEESFALRPPLHRMLVVAAGPIFNFVLAWFIYSGLFLSYGLVEPLPVIGEVVTQSAAAEAGFVNGDKIIAIDGKPIPYWADMSRAILESEGRTMTFTVERDGQSLVLDVTPRAMQDKNIFGEPETRYVLGVRSSGEFEAIPLGPGEALTRGGTQTWESITIMGQAILKLVQGVVPLDTVGGPIMIGDMVNQQAQKGLAEVLYLTAFISINLGLLNLLPIPVLDGGHILFFTWELVFRRPVSIRWQIITTRIGIVLLMSLMALAIFNDLYRIYSNWGV